MDLCIQCAVQMDGNCVKNVQVLWLLEYTSVSLGEETAIPGWFAKTVIKREHVYD